MNRTFHAGLLTGFGLVVALLVVNAVVSFRNTRQLDEDSRWVAHTHEVLDALEEMLGTLRDAETGQRGYLLTGEDKYLAPYQDALRTYEEKIERVRRLTADNQTQHDLIPTLREPVAAKIKELERTVALAKQGDTNAALQVVKTGEGKRLMDSIRANVHDMVDEERRLLVQRQAATDRAYATAVRTGILAAVLGVAAVGGFAWLLERHLRSRMRAAAVIHRERETLRATLVSIGDGVIVADAQGQVTFLNAVAQQLTGWQLEDARGKPLGQVFHIVNEQSRSEVANPALRALREGRIVGLANHTLLIARDGTERPIDDSAAPIQSAEGKVVGAVLVFRDITDRKQAEDRIRQSEKEFRQLADAMPQIVWTARPDGDLDYYNERWYEFTGFGRGVGGDESREPIVHPDDVQGCKAAWGQSVRTGQPYQIECRFHDRRSGGYRWFLGRALPVRDESGRVVKWFGTSTDIDDRKRAEEQLQKADRRKDEFLATLAHELRNPLAPLRNGLQIMRMAGGDAGAVERAQGVMERQLGQMVRLVDDLLDISRITRGKLLLHRERVDLAGVVQSALEGSRPLIEASGNRLTVSLPPEPVEMDADPMRLAQVFANLLTNAAKYTERGGDIWLIAKRRGAEVVVSVRDTGIGIAAEHLPHLFEMFSQLTPALERSQGGLGIGLSLSKGLVEMHDGSIEARSEGPGKGSEFTVRLPVVGGTPGRPTKASVDGDQAPARPRRRILVADDNRDAADSLATMLRLEGHEVHAVYDGLEAVEAAAWFRPELALLDIGMPGLNGFEAARRIRGQPWGRQTVLVAISGWGQEEDKRMPTDAGFDHHLTKPVDPAALEKLLAESKRA
jgi:PAS domain S-box-containing protein